MLQEKYTRFSGASDQWTVKEASYQLSLYYKQQNFGGTLGELPFKAGRQKNVWWTYCIANNIKGANLWIKVWLANLFKFELKSHHRFIVYGIATT